MSSHTLLVATTGGHLEELARLAPRMMPRAERHTWVTHESSQAESLLAGEDILTVPYVPPRGYRQLARVSAAACGQLRRAKVDRVISTGAGVALSYFFAARARRVECHYVESATRVTGPGLTGKVSARLPGVRLYTQHERWSGSGWAYRGSVFDDFEVAEQPPGVISKVVVSLGTMRTYAFTRMVDQLRAVLPEVMSPGAEVLWQTGATPATDLPGRARPWLTRAELEQAVAEADLVITHGGIGSALMAMDHGKRPLLVPRRGRHGEHVDDHQALITGVLAQREIAVEAEADEITPDHLVRAASGRVSRTAPGTVPFRLTQR